MPDATKQFIEEYKPFTRRAAEKHWLYELVEDQEGLIDQVLQATIHEKLICGSPDLPEEIILEKTEEAYREAEKQITNKIRRQERDTLKKFERIYLLRALEYIEKEAEITKKGEGSSGREVILKDSAPDHTAFAKKAYENAFCKILEGGSESLEEIVLESIVVTADKERIRGNPSKWFVRLDELTKTKKGRARLAKKLYKRIRESNPKIYEESDGPVNLTIPDIIIMFDLPMNTEIKREYYASCIDWCVEDLENWEYEIMRLWCSGLKFKQVGQIFGVAKSTMSGYFKDIQAKIQKCVRGENNE